MNREAKAESIAGLLKLKIATGFRESSCQLSRLETDGEMADAIQMATDRRTMRSGSVTAARNNFLES